MGRHGPPARGRGPSSRVISRLTGRSADGSFEALRLRHATNSGRHPVGHPDPRQRDGLAHRADELLGRLNLDEKIAMLHQHSPGVPRLGIAAFSTGAEALHGVAWNGVATVFPQAVGLGATWDAELVAAVGAAVGAELRAVHRRDPMVGLNVWAPVVNLLRDPRWGRNEEGYSEDPLLTAGIAMAYCSGLRGDHPVYLRTAPLLKHFLAYNNEADRDTTSSVIRPRVLHEYELPPFRAPIEAGLAVGVMPSYNLVNGRPNHVSPALNDLLRAWTAQELLVCSDAGAPSNLVDTEHYFPDHPASHAAALRAGIDSFTDHDADSSVTIGRITRALHRGLITIEDVDRAVRRLLLIRFRLGEFDPGLDPYAGAGEPALSRGPHRELARRAARQAIVLLKNDGGVLPLAARPGLRVAVVGPFADALRTDWYSGTMPYQITVAGGLRDALGGAGAVIAADGADLVDLRAAAAGGPGLGEFEVFDWGPASGAAAVMTFRSASSGRYLTVAEDGSLAPGPQQPGGWVVRETFAVEPDPADAPDPGQAPGLAAQILAAQPERFPRPGQLVVLRSTATGRYIAMDGSSGALAASAPAATGAYRLRWQVLRDGVAAAARAAARADACVLVVGNDPLINGRETQDRITLALPPAQQRLALAVHSAAPRLVLVVMSSYPYALGWAAERVPAIIWTSHGGQEAGRGLADVLLGRHDPSGRLPQTWYARDADLPGLLDYDIIKSRRTYLYFEGRPLYPFGHGLSYTTFGYSGLRLSAGGGEIVTVAVDVTNTGTRPGTEVVQAYTRPLAPRRPLPQRALAGWARVTLAPGVTRTVTIPLPVSCLGYWAVATHRMTVDPGDYEIAVGSSSARIDQTARLTVPGPWPGPRRMLDAEVAAADFDDYENVTLVDETRERGDAVAPAADGPGWILFSDTDLRAGPDPAGPLAVTLRIARETPGPARVELRLGDPAKGELLGVVAAPLTGGRYAWTQVHADLAAPAGTGPGAADLYLVLHGAQRLASLRVHRRAAATGGAPRDDG